MSVNGYGNNGAEDVVFVVDTSDVNIPAMESDPWHVWMVCDECGVVVDYARSYGVGETPAAFVGFVKAGLVDAYQTHLLEDHV